MDTLVWVIVFVPVHSYEAIISWIRAPPRGARFPNSLSEFNHFFIHTGHGPEQNQGKGIPVLLFSNSHKTDKKPVLEMGLNRSIGQKRATKVKRFEAQ